MDPTFGSYNPFDFGDPTQPQAPLPQTMPAPPLPEQVASFLGNKNVTPEAFLANPMAFLPRVDQAPQQAPLGGALEPQAPQQAQSQVPLPQPRPASAPGATAPASTVPNLAGLANLKAPPAPVGQTVRTPAAQVPGPHGSIKGGNLIALLTALGGQVPTAKVPLALGGQVSGR